ncbi:MAG TPA: hypothetical protein VH253_12035 [Phycisphaerae bacterium]|nr:hypothetical protein [Phycisphaerae bacterium]
MPVTLKEVHEFTASLNRKIEKCENGEGLECATLDAALSHYAGICCEYMTGVREWARAIFSDKQKFDGSVEEVWKREGRSLYTFGLEIAQYSEQAGVDCYDLPGQCRLKAALADIDRLLRNWVIPAPSIAPAARIGLPGDVIDAEKIGSRLDSLPPLPADWKPSDRVQRLIFRALRRGV